MKNYDKELVELVLPYPPTVNHIWGRCGANRSFLTPEYRSFLNCVSMIVGRTRLVDALGYSVHIVAVPPDRRKRDLDNIFKAIFDSFTRCGLWTDDSKVVEIYARREEPQKQQKRGVVRVAITALTKENLEGKNEQT